MRIIIPIIYCILYTSCGYDRNVEYFKGTKTYGLAKAVADNNIKEIKEIVTKNPGLLDSTNYQFGSNVLELSVHLENYEAFKHLIELGANPNFINPLSRKSVLIEACKYYWKPESYTIDLRYIDLLLKKGADPNYVVDSDFTDDHGNHQNATSALHEASRIDLTMVKLLIQYGGNPLYKLKSKQESSFGNALSSGKFNIINYYIDSLKVNINEPLYIDSSRNRVINIPEYIQKYMAYSAGSTQDSNKNVLIKKLEKMGVNFKKWNIR